MTKAITWIVIIVVVIGGIWYYMSRSSAAPTSPGASDSTMQPAQEGSATSQGSVSASGSSDAELQGDLNTVDSQMQAAGSANTSAGSFNDTPVTQTE